MDSVAVQAATGTGGRIASLARVVLPKDSGPGPTFSRTSARRRRGLTCPVCEEPVRPGHPRCRTCGAALRMPEVVVAFGGASLRFRACPAGPAWEAQGRGEGAVASDWCPLGTADDDPYDCLGEAVGTSVARLARELGFDIRRDVTCTVEVPNAGVFEVRVGPADGSGRVWRSEAILVHGRDEETGKVRVTDLWALLYMNGSAYGLAPNRAGCLGDAVARLLRAFDGLS